MNVNLGWLIPAVAALLLGACQTSPGVNSDYGLNRDAEMLEVAAHLDRLNMSIGEAVSMISTTRVDGWAAINDRNLILTAGRRDYLVRLDRRCSELRYAWDIGLDTRGGILTRGDSIVANSNSNTLGMCRISQINALIERSDDEG